MTSQKPATKNLALKWAIVQNGLTQRVTAKRARMHETKLSRVISRQEEASAVEKRRLARILGADVSALFPVSL